MGRHHPPEPSPLIPVIGMICITTVLVTMALTGGSRDIGAIVAAAFLAAGYMISVRIRQHWK